MPMTAYLSRALPGLLLLAMSFQSGCQAPPPVLTGSGMDMFAPVQLRLHPLTRVFQEKERLLLEAHLEFTDQMGDVTKGVGQVEFQLFRFDLLAPEHKGPYLTGWKGLFDSPSANRDIFDPITRTYLFSLTVPELKGPLPDGRYILTAIVQLPNRNRLSDDLTIKKGP